MINGVTIEACVDTLVLVRPWGGSVGYFTGNDIDILERQVIDLRNLGVHGVATGALTRDLRIDEPLMSRLRELARPIAVTFHRAFDSSRDALVSLEMLVNLAVGRVLTSGHAPDAEAGIPGLKELVRAAGNRIGIIATGGIRGHNVLRIVLETGVREIHSRGDIGPIVRALKAGSSAPLPAWP